MVRITGWNASKCQRKRCITKYVLLTIPYLEALTVFPEPRHINTVFQCGFSLCSSLICLSSQLVATKCTIFFFFCYFLNTEQSPCYNEHFLSSYTEQSRYYFEQFPYSILYNFRTVLNILLGILNNFLIILNTILNNLFTNLNRLLTRTLNSFFTILHNLLIIYSLLPL